VSSDNPEGKKPQSNLLFEIKDGDSVIQLVNGVSVFTQCDALVIPYNSRYEIDRNVIDYYSIQPEYSICQIAFELQ
jgi:hypothetical protein